MYELAVQAVRRDPEAMMKMGEQYVLIPVAVACGAVVENG